MAKYNHTDRIAIYMWLGDMIESVEEANAMLFGTMAMDIRGEDAKNLNIIFVKYPACKRLEKGNDGSKSANKKSSACIVL